MLAVLSGESLNTAAFVVSFGILTGSSVFARIGRAFVDLDAAVSAAPASFASAESGEVTIHTGSVLPTRRRGAEVNFNLASFASKSCNIKMVNVVNLFTMTRLKDFTITIA